MKNQNIKTTILRIVTMIIPFTGVATFNNVTIVTGVLTMYL